jgi:hypothetical protein
MSKKDLSKMNIDDAIEVIDSQVVENGNNVVENGNNETTIDSSNSMDSLNAKLASALTIDTDSLFTTIKTADGGELDVTKKTYQFANPIGKRDSMTIYDTAIIESMEKISHALHGKAILTYAICKEFSKIAESGKLENMGFKTIADFGKAIYGLETSTVNHYTRIGSTFINDDYTVKAGLPDLSVSHFIELSAQVKDGDITPIIELYQNGTLVDGMSTKRIRETLKSLSSGNVIEDKSSNTSTSATNENENTGVTIPNDSEITELEANFDSQVVIGRIISAASVIEQLFDMLNKNDIKAVGYSEHVDAIKAIAKTLL